MPLDIVGVNHFCVSVHDLEAAISWYGEKLGFQLICRDEIPKINVKAAHLRAPDFVLELFEAEGANPLPEERRHPNTDLMTHGNKHFSVTVKDADKARAQLEAMGVEIVMTARVWGTVGMFIRDPTGNLIEIFEGDMRNLQQSLE
jgi:catechol 2,3-dioxygenase-like lactoylglutathione lyase family enzyme